MNVPEPSSFRDPSGRLVRRAEGALCRQVTAAGLADLDLLTASGLAAELIGSERLIPFREAERGAEGALLELEELPFVSYPWEWPPEALRDAALLTCDVALAALERGMTLKDAGACNIGWRGSHPVFLDHGSFTAYREGEPWRPLRQFIAHFLGPLLLVKYRHSPEYLLLAGDFPDGLPIDFVAHELPWRSRLSPSVLLHIHCHAALEARGAARREEGPERRRTLPRSSFRAMLLGLREMLLGMEFRLRGSEWSGYYRDTNYTEDAFAAKREAVAAFAAAVRPRRVIDFGANNGLFSCIAGRHAEVTVAADLDFAAVSALYRRLRSEDDRKVHPVRIDLNVPSPGSGLFNREHLPFLARAKGDLAMGLALIHHLRIGANWHWEHIARLFAESAPAALVEFVPESDSQVRRLLRTRERIHDDWDLDSARAAFGRFYRSCEVLPLPGSERSLLLLRDRIGGETAR